MDVIYLDFETKSDVPIDCGIFKYLAGAQADIICCSYKVNTDKTQMWMPGAPIPTAFKDIQQYKVYAFNIQFDRRVWNTLGQERYGLPFLPLSNCIDVMALCARYGFPQSLDAAGDALELNVRKDKYGKSLLKKITTPPFKYTDQEFRDFLNYCITDTDVLYEMVQTLPLPSLAPLEQQYWELTAEINERGVPIDIDAVQQILRVTKAYQIEHAERLPSLTGGIVSAITQVKRIRDFCDKQGYYLSNLTADTVSKALADETIPPKVHEILTMRKELGKSSVAKFTKLETITHEGRVYDNLRYYGAGTGRWAGMGFQLHNLPRDKADDPDSLIDSFFDLSILEDNPVAAARKLIRPMIKAPKGKLLAVADYSSIEYIILMWLCHDLEAVDRFYLGFDQYVDMATFLYNKPYDKISKSERQMGKIIILGCGYGLGWQGFQGVAENWGVKLPAETCQEAVNAFRTKHHVVPEMWYRSKDMMVGAIQHPGTTFSFKSCQFKVVTDPKNNTRWMKLTLPSGRAIFYNEPQLRQDTYGMLPTAMGRNPYSKKWQRLKIIPGRIVENIVQGLARDVLAFGKLQVNKHYPVIGSVHDEIIAEVNKHEVDQGDFTIDTLYSLMCTTDDWAEGLPIKADGYIGKRYKKF